MAGWPMLAAGDGELEPFAPVGVAVRASGSSRATHVGLAFVRHRFKSPRGFDTLLTLPISAEIGPIRLVLVA